MDCSQLCCCPPSPANMPSDNKECEVVETKRRKQEIHPLKMGSILEVIFGFLDVKSIKNARQVNQLWNIEGARILITKCFVRISSNLRSPESLRKSITMIKFKAFLAYKSSEISMIPNITIDNIGDVELWKSFGVLGTQVKSLKLNTIDEKAELLHNILDLLPNLKYLMIKDCKQLKDKAGAIIKVFASRMSKSEKNQSPIIISSIPLKPESVEEFEEIEKLSDCKNVMIEKLHFEMKPSLFYSVSQYEARTAKVLSKNLLTSQKTLRKLMLIFCDIYLPLVQFPCMTTLTKMGLLFFRPTPGSMSHYKFAPCFRFSDKVPNLHHFGVSCEKFEQGQGANFFTNLFENTGAAPSVRSIMFYDSPDGLSIDPLFQNFPNTKTFIVVPSRHTRKMFNSLCEYKKNIKRLEISIDLNPFVGEVAELDSIFTGFTPEIVDWIKRVPKEVDHTINNVEQLRVNPSILDFQALEVLKVRFIRNGTNLLPERTLAIAGAYAIRYMPKKSKIFIRVNDNACHHEGASAALDEVSKLPNVTVEFKDI